VLTNDQIEQALAVLDANVAGAEANLAEAQMRLAEARAERRGADALAAILRAAQGSAAQSRSDASDGDHETAAPAVGRGVNTGLTHVIEEAVRSRPDATLSINDVMAIPEISRLTPTRQQVRNGLYYLSRKGILERERGSFNFRLEAERTDTHSTLNDRESEQLAVPF
jgi:hypothetical protein